MPRDGSGVYSTPTGTYGTPNAKILSAPYNSNVDDVAADLNTPRPIVAGGTGATTAAGALTALGAVAKTGDTMTGNLMVTANLMVVGAIGLGVGTPTFASSAGSYTNIFDTAANAAITIGSGSDPGNYYRNTSHNFQGIAGSGGTVVKIGTGAFSALAASLNIPHPGNSGPSAIVMRSQSDTGTAYPLAFRNGSDVTVGSVTNTVSTTAFNTVSDARLKEDLKSFDAGNIIDDTKVYDFKWKSTDERAFGVVAQQAVEVYPQAVTYHTKEDWWGIDYSKYVPVLLQELKALRARVATLEGGDLSGKPA